MTTVCGFQYLRNQPQAGQPAVRPRSRAFDSIKQLDEVTLAFVFETKPGKIIPETQSPGPSCIISSRILHQQPGSFRVSGIVRLLKNRCDQFLIDSYGIGGVTFFTRCGNLKPKIQRTATGGCFLPRLVIAFFPEKDFNQTRVVGRAGPTPMAF